MLGRFSVSAVIALALASAGCKENGEKRATAAAPTAAVDAQLIARRDALLKSRQSLEEEQAKLAAERQKIIEAGGDTAEVDRKAAELQSKHAELSSQESGMLEQILEQNKALLAASAEVDGTAAVTARETAMAGREGRIADREKKVAEREAQIANREKALAAREKETCGVAPAPTTIIQTVGPKGSKYDKRDVEPMLKKARNVMNDRGILASDLPGDVRELEKEATQAMGDGDYGRAYLAANQFFKTVSAMPIDRAFIQAKSARISALAKGKQLAGPAQKQFDDLLSDATARFVDGDYKGANRKLNAIWNVIH